MSTELPKFSTMLSPDNSGQICSLCLIQANAVTPAPFEFHITNKRFATTIKVALCHHHKSWLFKDDATTPDVMWAVFVGELWRHVYSES